MATGHARLRVPATRLRRRVRASELGFRSTAEVPPLEQTIGQPRALDAIRLGLDVEARGFNLFVTGLPGSGRETVVLDHLRAIAPGRPPASDWVYVETFTDPDQPTALELPAGRGRVFAAAVDELIVTARRQVRQALESDEYSRRKRELTAEVAGRRDAVFERLRDFAQERGFTLEPAVSGIATVPLHDGRPLTPELFSQLSAAERQRLEEASEEIQERVSEALGELRGLEKEAAEIVGRLDREVAEFAIDPLLRELRGAFADLPAVAAHVDALRLDVLAHLREFGADEPDQATAALAALGGVPPARQLRERYRVNVFVDQADTAGAPVVVERQPTYYNLMGRIDYRSAFGTMVTNVQEIKPGALHRANGGFLVMHAADVLRTPFAWDALKGALTSGEARIENLAAQLSVLPTASLRPQPIALRLKVILIGTPYLYRLLCQLDDDFLELFKVRVDFAPDTDWSAATERGYAALVSRVVRDQGLRHFNASAVGRLIEHGARLREHQGKLTLRMADIVDLVVESSHWADRRGSRLVGAADVDRAIEQRDYRSNLIEERVREVITEGTLTIETSGSRVGQVNGVAVLDSGDHAFGRPARITCRTSVGAGGVVSIDREIELSGPVHSKGVLTLAGYLTATYAQEWPLAVAATLTFEQSYDEVDGDSASSTELYALLSALSDLPVAQGIAVTGSVDQNGNVQAVGGVTTKLEGFFRVCREAGLTGDQGMLIPAANVPHLMLDDEVVSAVRDGRFHVWAIHTIDQGIEILTGRRAGVRRADGTFAADTVHGLVDARLRSYAHTARQFARRGPAVSAAD